MMASSWTSTIMIELTVLTTVTTVTTYSGLSTVRWLLRPLPPHHCCCCWLLRLLRLQKKRGWRVSAKLLLLLQLSAAALYPPLVPASVLHYDHTFVSPPGLLNLRGLSTDSTTTTCRGLEMRRNPIMSSARSIRVYIYVIYVCMNS